MPFPICAVSVAMPAPMTSFMASGMIASNTIRSFVFGNDREHLRSGLLRGHFEELEGGAVEIVLAEFQCGRGDRQIVRGA